jgi:hypothetical protein
MRLYKRLRLLHLGYSFHPSVGPHITLNVIFSIIYGRKNLKFGEHLQVDLHFLFFVFFLLSSSSNSSFSSQEFKFIHIQKAKQHIGKGRIDTRQQVYALHLGCIEGPNSELSGTVASSLAKRVLIDYFSISV